ncbi:unnamed protein product, partial [Rotaria sordida]
MDKDKFIFDDKCIIKYDQSTELESGMIGKRINGDIDEILVYDGVSLDDVNYKSV